MRARSDVPIIVVTAKGEEVDRVVGLELGADDYVVKPFGLRELVARIRAVSRRAGAAVGRQRAPRRSDELTLDLRARRASDRRPRAAAHAEGVRPARAADARRRAVVTKQRILNEVWNTSWYGADEDRRRPRRVVAQEARRPGSDRDRPRRRPPLSQRPVTRRLLLSYLVLTLGVLDRARAAARDPQRAQPAAGPALEGSARRGHARLARGGRARAQTSGRRERARRRRSATRRRPTRTSSCATRPVASSSTPPARGRRRGRASARGLLVTMPVAANGRVFGTVAITYPTSSTDRRIVRDWFGLAIAAAVVLAARRGARPAALAFRLATAAPGRARGAADRRRRARCTRAPRATGRTTFAGLPAR